MTFETNGRPRRPIGRVAARSIAAGDDTARQSAAVLVVAFSCAASGLLMGLCLAAAHWPALAFVFGAVLAGTGAWFAKDLVAQIKG
ncbi:MULTISPECIES: hypothetical protein [Xanthobacter]|uniref:Uncharacterized protein n=1 Tax=Xanthobacter oligotrophicus TaxID=2607286 RepID=A0ABW6ZUV8_9HYPH|nr:hypothetical protein [Xanthobacter oligotrophicus]MCG5236551.1 hypothetical protein [Xanthobacter oligotrophicus]